MGLSAHARLTQEREYWEALPQAYQTTGDKT